MSANDIQIGGSHYQRRAIQPWDFIIDNGLGFLEGNIIKYVARYKDKNGVEDLKKARHYLDKLIEVAENVKEAGKEQRPTGAELLNRVKALMPHLEDDGK